MDNPKLGARFGWFYGEVRKRIELPFLTLTEVTYAPGFEVPAHQHKDRWFGFVLEGELFETYRNRTTKVTPMTAMFRIAGETHSDRAGEQGARSLVLDLKGPSFSAISEEFDVLKCSSEFSGGALPSIMLRIHKEFHINDGVVQLALEGLLLELIAESSRRSVPRLARIPPWLERTIELLRSRFTESLDLSEVAMEIGVHPVHLARTFRKLCGTSVGEYVRLLRIEAAYNQLVDTDIPLVQLAVMFGFCDQAHFSRTFKRVTGMSPIEIRRSIAGPRGRSKHPAGRKKFLLADKIAIYGASNRVTSKAYSQVRG